MEAKDSQIISESLESYFQRLLLEAVARQSVSINDIVVVYLMRLLTTYSSTERLVEFNEAEERTEEVTLAFLLKRALEAPPSQRIVHLKQLGDVALFVSGFLPDSLNQKLVDVDYYASMGEHAYRTLSESVRRLNSPTGSEEVFESLANQFSRCVDLLGDVAEHSNMADTPSVLRLYERCLKVPSPRLLKKLESQGILFNPSLPTDFTH